MYRIKTKFEFISAFGKDWRAKVYRKFPIEMDHLLGKELTETQFNKIKNRDYYYLWEYNISNDMIINTSKSDSLYNITKPNLRQTN